MSNPIAAFLDKSWHVVHQETSQQDLFPKEPISYLQQGLLEDVLAARSLPQHELVGDLRKAFDLLLSEGLQAASAHARRWIQEGHFRVFDWDDLCTEAACDVPAPAATSMRTLSAVLYVDGVALAVLQTGESVEDAQATMEAHERSCPAWFVTPALLVAWSAHGAAVTVPAARGDRWLAIEQSDLSQLLEPQTLLRFALFDVTNGPDGPEFLPPATVRAVEAAYVRAVEDQADGLLCIPEGAAHLLAVRSLVARLLDERPEEVVPVVLISGRETTEQMGALLADFSPVEPESGLDDGALVLGRVSTLAKMYDWMPPRMARRYVVLALDVDAGFRNDQGLACRQLMPRAPWISFTRVEPDGVVAPVKHAFANRLDDEGFLDIVEATSGRIPIEEVVIPEGLMSVSAAVEMIERGLPGPEATEPKILILVPSDEYAAELAQALDGRGRIAHNATEWGKASEGWRLFEEGYDAAQPIFVIRTSLPFWAKIPHLDAAFIFRSVGRITLARTRIVLGRPHPGKTSALLVRPGHWMNGL